MVALAALITAIAIALAVGAVLYGLHRLTGRGVIGRKWRVYVRPHMSGYSSEGIAVGVRRGRFGGRVKARVFQPGDTTGIRAEVERCQAACDQLNGKAPAA